MIRSYCAEMVRAAEEPALEAGVPLMQRAADALAARVAQRLPEVGEPAVLVLVGGGSNGGDGLYAAAALSPTAAVTVALVRAPVHGEGLAAARAAGVEVLDMSAPDDEAWEELARAAQAADVWIDALAGLGSQGPLRGVSADVVRELRDLADTAPVPPVVVAVDLVSGVEADTGAVAGAVLAADATITFGALKPGHLLPPGSDVAGEVEVVGIGVERALAASPAAVSRLTTSDAGDLWPVPDRDAHKYTRGVVGVLAGSSRYPGAAVLSVGGALGVGCGMVRYLGPDVATGLVLQRFPEVVSTPGRVQSYVLGSGVDPGDGERRAQVREALAAALRDQVAVVVDAGALDLLPEPEQVRRARVVLTPHAGELARLLTSLGGGLTTREQVQAQPHRCALEVAQQTGATVLLKGSTTVVVAPDGESYSQADGSPWLATAGSGDVLGGVLGSLLAGLSEVPAARVAALAALVHGRAGVRAARRGPFGASALAPELPGVVHDLLAGRG